MKENKTNKKILLHACCAICSGYPIKFLRSQGFEPIVYFFNPNIYPAEEYCRRLNAQKKLCKALNCELIVENYEQDLYDEVMDGFENYEEGSERCKRCFELRLLKTIQKAKELGIENYTTSISISPHKKFNVIKQVGQFFSEYFKIKFCDYDFKKQNGFLLTNKIAHELDLYRQNYCGCNMSMKRFNVSQDDKIKH